MVLEPLYFLILCRMLQRGNVSFDFFSLFLSSIKKIAKLFRLHAFSPGFIKSTLTFFVPLQHEENDNLSLNIAMFLVVFSKKSILFSSLLPISPFSLALVHFFVISFNAKPSHPQAEALMFSQSNFCLSW